jgi:hypothetical protein
MSERSDTSRWLSEDAALGVLELSRGAGRELLNKGWLQPQQDGIFREAEIVEATILKHIRPSLGRSSEASNTWTALRKDGTVGGIVQLALSEDAALRFEIVVDELTRSLSGVVNDEQLVIAVRGPLRRRLVFIDLTEELNARLTAFCRRANRGPVPASRRGRPRKTADVHALPLRATSS